MRPPSQPSPALRSATRPTSAITIATMLMATCMPLSAPLETASRTPVSVFSTAISSDPAVTGTPVSGRRILLSRRPPAAFRTLAATRLPPTPSIWGCRKATYTAMTALEAVAKLTTMRQTSSDWVRRAMKGLMSSGTCAAPRKMLAAAARVSAPEVRATALSRRSRPRDAPVAVTAASPRSSPRGSSRACRRAWRGSRAGRGRPCARGRARRCRRSGCRPS